MTETYNPQIQKLKSLIINAPERIISASGICIQTVWIEAFVIGAMIVIVGNHVLKM